MDFLMNNEIVADYETKNILLFNKDCKIVLESFSQNSIDMIVTDPPYKLTKRGGGQRKER